MSAVMPDRTLPVGSIETGFDGQHWYNRVVGSYVIVLSRDSAEETERKGRVMAEMRRAEHLVMNSAGGVVSHVRYA